MLALLTCMLLALDVLTVDDNGPADYPDIASAVAASQPGDTLLVAGGTYGAFRVDHAVSVLASTPADLPRVLGETLIVHARDVTLAGLRFVRLVVWQAPGPIAVRGGDIGVWADPGHAVALDIQECRAVVVSRVTVNGSEFNDWTDPADGVAIRGSNAAFSDCYLAGAEGWTSDELYGYGGKGGIGVHVTDGSRVWLAATSVHGGPGGWGTTPFSPTDGEGGTGLRVSDSELVACGSTADTLVTGPSDFGFGAHPGHSLILEDSSARVSGVVLGQNKGPVLLGTSTLAQPAVPDPFVVIEGGAPWSTSQTARFHGPPGMILTAGIGPLLQPSPVPQILGELWFEPRGAMSVLFSVTAAGQNMPVAVPLPPAWLGPVGAASVVQAVAPQGAPTFLLVPDVLVTSP